MTPPHACRESLKGRRVRPLSRHNPFLCFHVRHKTVKSPTSEDSRDPTRLCRTVHRHRWAQRSASICLAANAAVSDAVLFGSPAAAARAASWALISGMADEGFTPRREEMSNSSTRFSFTSLRRRTSARSLSIVSMCCRRALVGMFAFKVCAVFVTVFRALCALLLSGWDGGCF